VIVGDANFKDPYVDDLRKHASNDVVFTGYRKGRTLAELFSNAYLYIQPSTLEGISVAVLEALSYGRCVLASDIPGNREALNAAIPSRWATWMTFAASWRCWWMILTQLQPSTA